MRDFLAFRTMLTPIIIQLIFWFGVIICVAVGIFLIAIGLKYPYEGHRSILKGLLVMGLGPVGVRIYCEILIIFFRINETLTEIKHGLEERRQQ